MPCPAPLPSPIVSLCVIAGDISPVDVISHLPGLCEEMEVPFVFVESKADLGTAAATKRPTSVILIAPKKGADFDGSDRLAEALEDVKAL